MRKAESKITFDKASWVIRKQHCYKTFLSFQVFSVASLRVPLREALICLPLREAEPKPCQGRQDDSVHQSRYEGFLRMLPSSFFKPRTAHTATMLWMATMLPMAAPTVCKDSIVVIDTPRYWAILNGIGPNVRFEMVFDPKKKLPRAPRNPAK